ncbi:MAG: hypothetical protein AAFX40_11890, partial [Cyanobacteria bacterium J06639_1]
VSFEGMWDSIQTTIEADAAQAAKAKAELERANQPSFGERYLSTELFEQLPVREPAIAAQFVSPEPTAPEPLVGAARD